MTKTNTTATELIDFITCATSPFHVVEKSAERLERAGFQELHPADAWRLFPGGRYFVKVYV